MTISKFAGVYAVFSYICLMLLTNGIVFNPSFSDRESKAQKGSMTRSILKLVKWAGIDIHT